MADNSPVNHQAEQDQIVTFDDQLWPLNVALIVLAGFVAGVIIALSSFDDTRVFYNGWVHLAVLTVAIGLLIWLASRLNSKRVRRGLQLAAVLSLLVHMLMMVALYNQRLEILARAAEEANEQVAQVAEEQVTLPDYNLPPPGEDQPQEAYEQPVAVEVPDDAPPQVVRAEAKPIEVPRESRPTPEPGTTPDVKPSTVKMAEVAETAPRRAEQASKLSRQTKQAEGIPAETVIAPPVETKTTGPGKVESAVKPLARQATGEVAAAKTNSKDPAAAVPRQQATQIARREQSQPTPAPQTSSPTLTRKVREPVVTPHSPADVPQGESVAQKSAPTPQPGSGVTRQPAAGPALAMQPSSEPKPARSVEVAPPNIPRGEQGVGQPAASKSPKPSSARTAMTRAAQPTAVAAGSPQVADAPQAVAGGTAGAAGPAQIGPAAAKVARVEAGSPATSATRGDSGAEGAAESAGNGAGNGMIAGSALQRAGQAAQPSIHPQAAPAARIGRAAANATVASSPVNAESPAAGIGPPSVAEPGQGGAQPGKIALTKGSAGSIGSGQSPAGGPGMGNETLRGTSQAGPVASTRANRSTGTGGGGAGPAVGTGGPAAIAKSSKPAASAIGGAGGSSGEIIAGADVPSSPSGAPGAAAIAGGPGGLEASASGTGVQRGAAGGPSGTGTGSGVGSGAGSDGAGALGSGPIQVASSLGANKSVGGRGPGGGSADAPSIHGGAGTGKVPRSGSGGVSLAAISAGQISDVPAAPVGEGGGMAAAGTPGGTGAGSGNGSGTGAGGGLNVSPGAGLGGRSALADLPGAMAGGANISIGGEGAGSGNGPGGSGNGTSGSGLGGGGPGGSGAGGNIAGGTLARATGGGDGSAGPTVAKGGTGDGTGSGAGGSGGRSGRAIGQAFAADTKAETIQLPTGPTVGEGQGMDGDGSGMAGGAPQVAGKDAVRGSAGLPGQLTGKSGAAAGDVEVDSPIAGGVGLGLGTRRSDNGAGEQGPTVAAIGGSGQLRKTNVAGIAGGIAEMIDVSVDAGQPGGAAATAPIAVAVAAGTPGGAGRRTSTLPVQVAAATGPGGLGTEVSLEVGSLNRRAQRDSEVVHSGTARFLSRKVGGPLPIDGRAREPAQAFSGRGGKRLSKGNGPGLPTERTEAAVEAGLDFLARHQSPDGSWSLNNFGAGRPGYENEKAAMQSDAAATGLALLTYLGAGYDHYDDQYKQVIQGGIDYLVKNQKENGDLYVAQDPESSRSAWLYTHGIASIALCEAYGMTGDEKLRVPAQKAIDFIVASQNPKLGGWRYTPQFQSDTSVSGWQLMALKSGELAGLHVPAETYTRVKFWLDSAKGSSDGAQYVYNPAAPNTTTQRHGRQASTSMTAVGLLMRMYTGWNRNDPRMVKGADQLLAHLPAVGTAARPARDTYYWYYATQVMFHMKGRYWEEWHEKLHTMLVERQVQSGPMAGSWEPNGVVPDRWASAGGRIYVTALNLLSLEVSYRHLPIYESTAK